MTVLEVEVVKAVRAPVTPASVRRAVARAAELPEIAARVPPEGGTIAIRITSDEEMERLNRDYAGEAHATDVLSFAGEGRHLGDVAISWPAVVTQAEEWRHDQKTEVAYLAVHGLLHLLGWDHSTRAEAREMMRLTRSALELSGLKAGSRSAARWSGYTPVRGLRRSPRA